MAKIDAKRLRELRAKEEAGTLTYLERIELELMLEDKGKEPEVEAGAWEDMEEKPVEPKVMPVPKPEGPSPEEEEFEVIPVTEELEEEGPAEGPYAGAPRAGQVAPEQQKMAAAFGAGALMGYFLRELLEDEDEEKEEGSDD